jgi:asparagine synthase (glutamine-hydrolysing)
MARPYVAVSWQPAAEGARAAARGVGVVLAGAGWASALQRPGLQVWSRLDRPIPVHWCEETQAVIVGHRLEESPRSIAPEPSSPDDSITQRAKRLCRSGWGAYVALLQEPRDGRWWGFRDPSGAVDALTWAAGDLQVLSSDLENVPPCLRPAQLGLDWTAIADFLRRPASLMARTALQGLETVAPGDVQPLGAVRGQATAIWRPRNWLPDGAEIDPTWPEQLAQTVQATIAGLVAPYERVVTEVSGGLDSSIVTAGVARAGLSSRIAAALHYAGEGGAADERKWADLLCVHYYLPLTCAPRAMTPFWQDSDFTALLPGARPPYAALDSARDADTAERLRVCGAQALITGKGGDAVFFQMPTAAVISDLWTAVGPAALRHPHNGAVARWLRRSVWSVWHEAFGPGPAEPAPPAVGRFAGQALHETPTGAAHPWLEGLEDAPRAKRIQIQALVGSHQTLGASRTSAAADLVQPLLAQPVMQLCLSIPSWELVRGGRDRGLARDAFAGWLPQAVANRQSKGALTSIYSRRVAASLDALRSHLLDGVLVGADLLDHNEIEAALQPDQLICRADGLDLLMAAAVESWARHWQTRVPDAADARRFRG